MAKVLITGCAGFIGSHLSKKLLKDGHEVWGVDNFATSSKFRLIDGVNFVEGDISDLEFKISTDGFEFVFHTAAIPRIPVSFEHPVKTLRNNFDSTLWALELCRQQGAKMIYSASSSVYGDQDVYPVKEDMEPRPASPYAYSKLAGEHLCENYKISFGVPYVALRYFNVIGTGMTEGGYATVLPIWLGQLAENKPLTITGDGLQERDFTAVEDVVQANILCMEKGEGVFNIGSDRPRKIIDVAKMLSEDVVYIEARREPKVTHADNSKAKEQLGWQTTRNLEDVLKELL